MKPLLLICRPMNCLMAAAASVLGSWLFSHDLSEGIVWIAALIVGLMTAGGNIMNDLADLRADQINRPNRPLASGKVTRASAVAAFSFAWGLAATLSAISLEATPANVVFTVFTVVTMYNVLLKGIPLVGNLAIAAITWLVLGFGAIAVAGENQTLLPQLLEAGAVLAALIHLSRELVKSIQDIEGDRAQKRLTLPMIIGKRSAIFVALAPIAALPVVSYYFLQPENYRDSFVLGTSLLAAVLIGVGSRSLHEPTAAVLARFSWYQKLSLAAGMLLLLAADSGWL